jgi:hypothetical protein
MTDPYSAKYTEYMYPVYLWLFLTHLHPLVQEHTAYSANTRATYRWGIEDASESASEYTPRKIDSYNKKATPCFVEYLDK